MPTSKRPPKARRRAGLASELPASIADPRAKRRGGAQPGNSNARKTGIYSAVVAVRDDVDAAAMPRDQSDQELALARVRLKDLILEQRQAPPEHWLSFEKAIQHYIDRIANITYKNAILGRQQGAAFTTVMDMIRQANEEQGVA